MFGNYNKISKSLFLPRVAEFIYVEGGNRIVCLLLEIKFIIPAEDTLYHITSTPLNIGYHCVDKIISLLLPLQPLRFFSSFSILSPFLCCKEKSL